MNLARERCGLVGLAALILAAAAGCGDDGNGSPEGKGPDHEVPENAVATNVIWTADMGDTAAYDSVTGSVHQRGCLDYSNTDVWILDSAQFQQETKFELVEDRMALSDKLNVSYATSLNAKFYEQSTEYRLMNDFQMDTHSIWALLQVNVKGPVLRRTEVRMSDLYYSKEPPDLATFRESCGDQFLYRIQTGASYRALLRITVNNLQEKNKITAKFSSSTGAAGITFKTNAEFENEFGLTQGSTHITSYVYKTGAITANVVNDLETLMEDAEQWLGQVGGDFQCSRAQEGSAWAGAFACPSTAEWQQHLLANRNRYAARGAFLSYKEAADWGTVPEPAKPKVPTGLAGMGKLGLEYGRHLVVRDALQSILRSPDLYVSQTDPLMVFGRADRTHRFPLLQHPETLPYLVDTDERRAAIEQQAREIEASMDGLMEIAVICTESGQQYPTIEEYCPEACADPGLASRYGGVDCVEQCRSTKMCDVALEYFRPDLDVIEIQANLVGKPKGLPASYSYRWPGETTWTTVTLPPPRQVAPMTCADYRSEFPGTSLADGDYLVYFGADPDRPFYVYCDGMTGGGVPKTYLTLPVTTPDTLYGHNPGDGWSRNDQLANYSSRMQDGFAARHYQRYLLIQSGGEAYLRPDTRYSVASGTIDSFCHAEATRGPFASFDIDLRGLPLEISHQQQFLTGSLRGTAGNTNVDWGFLRIQLGADPAPRHQNRVLQKVRWAVTSFVPETRVVYAIDFTTAEDDATLNDGQHSLQASHPVGSLRLAYIDAPVQQALWERIGTQGTGRYALEHLEIQNVVTWGSAQYDKILSFRTAAF